jgi:predicted kinase
MRFNKYLSEQDDGNYSIFFSLLTEGVYDPSIFKAVFLAGGPGSGKSFVAKKTTLGLGFRLVNSDTLFEKLAREAGIDLGKMDFNDPNAQKRDAIRTRAKELTAKQMDSYIKNRIGIVIDGTGRDYDNINEKRERLKKLGYDTYMVFVNTSLDVAHERNQKRERTVPDELVERSWKAVQSNMGKFQTLFGTSNFKIVDNNVYRSDREVFADTWKEVMKFAKEPPNNKIAKAWIQNALQKKKEKK